LQLLEIGEFFSLGKSRARFLFAKNCGANKAGFFVAGVLTCVVASFELGASAAKAIPLLIQSAKQLESIVRINLSSEYGEIRW